jgi:hypothetical protein
MVPNEILVRYDSYDTTLLEVVVAYFKTGIHLKGMMKTMKNLSQDPDVDLLGRNAMWTCRHLPTY